MKQDQWMRFSHEHSWHCYIGRSGGDYRFLCPIYVPKHKAPRFKSPEPPLEERCTQCTKKLEELMRIW